MIPQNWLNHAVESAFCRSDLMSSARRASDHRRAGAPNREAHVVDPLLRGDRAAAGARARRRAPAVSRGERCGRSRCRHGPTGRADAERDPHAADGGAGDSAASRSCAGSPSGSCPSSRRRSSAPSSCGAGSRRPRVASARAWTSAVSSSAEAGLPERQPAEMPVERPVGQEDRADDVLRQEPNPGARRTAPVVADQEVGVRGPGRATRRSGIPVGRLHVGLVQRRAVDHDGPVRSVTVSPGRPMTRSRGSFSRTAPVGWRCDHDDVLALGERERVPKRNTATWSPFVDGRRHRRVGTV